MTHHQSLATKVVIAAGAATGLLTAGAALYMLHSWDRQPDLHTIARYVREAWAELTYRGQVRDSSNLHSRRKLLLTAVTHYQALLAGCP